VVNWTGIAMGVMDPPGPNWLGQKYYAMTAVVLVNVWRGLPFFAITILAGLVSIPREFYEAAEADGAGPVARFWHITLPLLRPTIVVAILFRAIDALKTFDIIFVITQGGPANSTETINVLLFNQAFSYFNMGYASSIAVALFATVMGASLLLIRLRRTAAW
jgi:multiple sugar transport system permease protein